MIYAIENKILLNCKKLKLLKNFGSKYTKKDTIPISVSSGNGDVSYKCSEVLEIWKRTFSNIFPNTFNEICAIEFYQKRFSMCSCEMNTLLIEYFIN